MTRLINKILSCWGLNVCYPKSFLITSEGFSATQLSLFFPG